MEGGVAGVCEPAGYCSFTDPGCPGGRRFEPNAGDGLAGACIAPPDAGLDAPPDAPICGKVGEACCATGAACTTTNGVCVQGSCQTCVTQIALGRRHSCAILHDGTVRCAGENTDGQLGNGMTSMMPTATPVEPMVGQAVLADAVQLSAGRTHTCAVRADKTVWCWGDNGAGQLGDGTTTQATTAIQVMTSPGKPLADIVEVGTSDQFTCARDTTGGVWCWGANFSGMLGDGTTTSHPFAAPVLVAPAGAAFTGATSLTLGSSHVCATVTGNSAVCWGSNNGGSVGDGTTMPRPNPVTVAFGEPIKSIAAGRYQTCGVGFTGAVKCWGQGFYFRLGVSTDPLTQTTNASMPMPVLLPGGAPVTNGATVALAALSCVVTTDHRAACWGENQYGQTGTGGGNGLPLPVLDPVLGGPLEGIDHITAHYAHACASMIDGRVLCWGRGSEGELMDPTMTNRGLATALPLTCP